MECKKNKNKNIFWVPKINFYIQQPTVQNMNYLLRYRGHISEDKNKQPKLTFKKAFKQLKFSEKKVDEIFVSLDKPCLIAFSTFQSRCFKVISINFILMTEKS